VFLRLNAQSKRRRKVMNDVLKLAAMDL